MVEFLYSFSQFSFLLSVIYLVHHLTNLFNKLFFSICFVLAQ